MYSSNLDYLEKYFNTEIICINSNNLIEFDKCKLANLIEPFDIIILGGGPQHLTESYEKLHPEILNQIELVKIITNSYDYNNKILLGICLGCQIIGLAFGHNIMRMNKINLGFGFINVHSVNYSFCVKDKYLKKINWNIISKAFSHHNDYIDWNDMEQKNYSEQDKLLCLASSINNVPYIVANTNSNTNSNLNSNVYGFQFHPEITFECVKGFEYVFENNNDFNYSIKGLDILDDFKQNDLEICLHFFDVFINS